MKAGRRIKVRPNFLAEETFSVRKARSRVGVVRPARPVGDPPVVDRVRHRGESDRPGVAARRPCVELVTGVVTVAVPDSVAAGNITLVRLVKVVLSADFH